MRDISTVPHHPAIEEIANVLSNKTQNTDMPFFRVMTAYFFAKMASNMRATIVTKDRGNIPVNMYALSLATSGSGKGFGVTLLEEEFLKGFKQRLHDDTLPTIAEGNLWTIANKWAAKKGTDPQTEYDAAKSDYARAGSFMFTFDSATVPAVKQLRHKLLMASAGALSLQIDEIGSNLMSSTEVLNAFLELYDQGLIKQKLTKNTNDNIRSEEVEGKTPTNMLLYGTPSKLLDGARTEDEFYSFLETGYARRCLFSYGMRSRAGTSLTAAQVYANLTQPGNQITIDKWKQHFTLLADPAKYNWNMTVADDVAIELLEYKEICEDIADNLGDHDEIKKAEISHRYFKSLKLAGAMAFIDESTEITMDHLYMAIKMVEESGKAFERIFHREKPYVKLAKYLAATKTEQTQADLMNVLPYFKGAQSFRNDLMNLATAYGYKNHIIIKKSFEQGIEFYRGETLKETDLNKMIVSYSDDLAYNYQVHRVPFEKLPLLTQKMGYHWVNHEMKNQHRMEENAIPGFNMVVIDVDQGTTIAQAEELLKEYTYLIHTTKRHTDQDPRFRLILPINYELELDADDFKQFMTNIYNWLPFDVDKQTNQRSRKWETFDGDLFTNEGEVLDALPFIPQTSKNDEHNVKMSKLESLDNLERWFAQRMVSGNRNNQLLRYAMMLLDSGMDYHEVESNLLSFNSKLDNGLSEAELKATVLVSVAKKSAQPTN